MSAPAARSRQPGCRRRSPRCAGPTGSGQSPHPGEDRAPPSACGRSCACALPCRARCTNPTQPVRISSTSPGSSVVPWAASVPTTSSGVIGSGCVHLERDVPCAARHRPTSASTARPAKASRGPVVHAVLLVGHTAVVAVHRMTDVPEPVPLRRALRVPAVHHVVVPDRRRLARHLVLEPCPTEQRRVGHPHVPVEREHCAPRWTSLAAATTRSGVRRLRQPKTSRSPHKPHDEPGGLPAATGSSSYAGSRSVAMIDTLGSVP